MTNHEHERATELIARRGTEELAANDVAWLDSHLDGCTECRDYAEVFESAGHLIRSTPAMASAALVSSTQLRLRARAHELQEQRSRMVLVAISFCLGALSSAVSAWLWWKFGGLLAEWAGLPQAIVQPGIMLFLLLPALVIAGFMLAFPQHALEERWMTALGREREGGSQ